MKLQSFTLFWFVTYNVFILLKTRDIIIFMEVWELSKQKFKFRKKFVLTFYRSLKHFDNNFRSVPFKLPVKDRTWSQTSGIYHTVGPPLPIRPIEAQIPIYSISIRNDHMGQTSLQNGRKGLRFNFSQNRYLFLSSFFIVIISLL